LRYASQVTNHLTANLPQNTMLMTTSYSPAAVLAYHHKQYVPVFGQGSHYARQDDLVVDFKALKGQNIRIFDRSAIRLEDYQPYFQSVQTQELHIHGATFYWLDGQGFLYDTSRRDILSQVVEQFHQIPPWLPILGNPFCERYGFAECSPPTHSLPNVRK